MTKNYFLIIDAGTGGGRALVFDEEGKLHAISYKEWTYHTPPDGPSLAKEFNPKEFWEIICNISKQAIQIARIPPSEIKGISASSFREGSVFLDAQGKELYAGPATDIRALEEGMELKRKLGEELYQITGHHPPFLFASARLIWFKRKRPEIYERIHRILMMNEWISFKFTGEAYCEPTSVCETQLFDIHQRAWSREIIEKLDLQEDIFPEVVNAGTKVGEITKQAAEETGLIEGTPVVMGGADSECALLGMGFTEEGQLGIIAGTTTPLQMIVSQPIIDEKQRTWTNNYLIPELWTVESHAGESGKVFRWMRDNLADYEREIARQQGRDAFEVMDQLAAEVPPGAEGVFAVLGPQVIDMNNLGPLGYGGFVFELPISMGNYGKKQFIRAFFENMAYAIKGNWDRIEEVAKQQVKEAGICGGLSKSRTFVQIVADVLRYPVKTYQTAEATGLGAAICAAIGTQIYPDFPTAIRAMVHLKEQIEPGPEMKKLRKYYKRWLKIQKKLSQLF
ncbi:MAG: FGGY-family carbohydrate kinase [Candidatus Helarchaeota archaeon]